MSLPRPSVPRKWAALAAPPRLARSWKFGSARWRSGARTAAMVTSASQAPDSQNVVPRRRHAAGGRSACAAGAATMTAWTRSGDCAAMADPGVEHRVQQVHDEVHKDEGDGHE